MPTDAPARRLAALIAKLRDEYRDSGLAHSYSWVLARLNDALAADQLTFTGRSLADAWFAGRRSAYELPPEKANGPRLQALCRRDLAALSADARAAALPVFSDGEIAYVMAHLMLRTKASAAAEPEFIDRVVAALRSAPSVPAPPASVTVVDAYRAIEPYLHSSHFQPAFKALETLFARSQAAPPAEILSDEAPHCDNVLTQTIGMSVRGYVCRLPHEHDGPCRWEHSTTSSIPQAAKKTP